ncbi:MAG TPA: hydrogenase maturation protease [Anaerolineales bacterium]|jgi:hydrogenase maturation protease|nr:hydrogenase maturation protease [Anaerolineales bacterium]
MKTLVLGLGNPLLRDDAVGLHVARRLRPLLRGRPGVEVDEDYRGGLRLMERLIGFDKAVIVDAICTGARPGTVHRLAPDGIPTQHSASAHDANLRTALDLGRQAGARLPADDGITLIGIEACDVLLFEESLTPEVEAAIPRAVRMILDELQGERGEP